jgi:hypothetical protein
VTERSRGKGPRPRIVVAIASIRKKGKDFAVEPLEARVSLTVLRSRIV